MFYVKFCGRKREIRDDNVYTRCSLCGQEHKVDLQDVLSTGDADLYSTSVYCPACAQERAVTLGALNCGDEEEKKQLLASLDRVVCRANMRDLRLIHRFAARLTS